MRHRVNQWTFCLLIGLLGCDEAPLTPTAQIATPPEPHAGVLEVAHDSLIGGWAWHKDRPDQPVEVELLDGGTPITKVKADRFRQDLVDARIGNGKHVFEFPMPDALKDGKPHEIHARIAGTSFELAESPRTYQFKNSTKPRPRVTSRRSAQGG
jgi:hypothetical protein